MRVKCPHFTGCSKACPKAPCSVIGLIIQAQIEVMDPRPEFCEICAISRQIEMGLAFIWVFKGNKALPRQFNHQARGVGPEQAHRPKNMAQTQCNAGRAGPYMQVNNFSKACISSSAATNFWRVWMRFHLLLLLTEKGSKMTILRRDLCCTLSPMREHVHEGNKSSAAVKTLNGQWRL